MDGDLTGSIVTANPVNTAVLGPYLVTYDVTDNAGNSATQVTRTVNVVDTTPPVITLLGSSPLDVEVGSVYTDAGATASDNVDGDLTGSIVTTNPVNTAVLGPYLVTYDVTDNAGNSATQVTRTVNVVDTTPPVISATVSPGPNASGWNNTDVTVSWSVEDPESGIASSVGCETTVLSAETTGTQLTCTATNGVDLSEFSVSRTISIDLTAPTASAAATPGPNANG